MAVFEQLQKLWTETEEKLPGFRYVTAVFLILAVLGYAVIKYKGADFWWILIPGFFVILLFVLFTWLIFTIVTGPPTEPGSDQEWMRKFLARFVLFLFVFSILTGITLGSTLALWHSPQALWTALGHNPDPRSPSEHDKVLAEAIFHSGAASNGDPTYDDVFSTASAMDRFLGHHACDFCRKRHFPATCGPDYTQDACMIDTALIQGGPIPRTTQIRHASSRPGPTQLVASSLQPAGRCSPTNLFGSNHDGRFLGVDLSHHDHVDWGRIAHAGVVFVYLKASQGATVVDPAFFRLWKEARQRGFMRGAYHMLGPEPASTQAAFFLRILARAGSGPCDLAPALDVEPTTFLDVRAAAPSAALWLNYVKAGWPRPPIVYLSNESFRAMGSPEALGAYELWLGDFSALSTPNIPSAWRAYRFRQFSYGNGPNSIEDLPYDTSEFDGTASQLLQLAAAR